MIRKLILSKKDYLTLFLVTLIAFWPISLNVFSLKNDALIYFLPYRYHISESIQNGMFPWWSPYIYTGLPIHGDIQSGVWNPVVMLISLFTSYNMTVLQWEMVFYLLIATVGVYKLVKEFNFKDITAQISAIMYVCCGFMTDSGSIVPWIISAAYLPFAFLYFFRLLNQPNLKTAIKLSIALSLLLTAGYPSFFIFSSYIMLAGFIVWLIINFKQQSKVKILLVYSFSAVVVVTIICAPALISWWEFLGYYDRGTGTDLNKALSNSFPPFSSISYLLPSTVSKDHKWLNTDLTARNASVGIFSIIFFVLSFLGKYTRTQKFILFVIVFSFLFSLGGATPLREWCYRFLPFMNSFRHPASIRIFTSLGIILIAASILNQILTNSAFVYKRLLTLTITAIFILIGMVVYYFPKINLFHFRITGINKNLLDRLNFADLAVFQGLIQLLFLFGFLLLLRKQRNKLLSLLIIINSVIFCWMALPFTFISQVKTRAINQDIATVPHGFPLPNLKTTVKTGFFSPPAIFDYRLLLNKNISIQDHIITPTINTSYIDFLNDTELRQALHEYPLVYSSDSSMSSQVSPASAFIRILGFSNNHISLKTSSPGNTTLNLFQQYHHGWEARIDKIVIPIFKSNIAFMGIHLPAGSHDVTFIFKPAQLIKIAMYLSAFIMLLILAYFVARRLLDLKQKNIK